MKAAKVLVVLTLLAIGATAATLATATPPNPTYGTAVVDGSIGEWNLTNDFFANMYRAGKPNQPLESKLYLRYDCETHTMYALCLREPADPIVAYPNPQQNWIAINSQANKLVSGLDQPADATPPDFAYYNLFGPTPPDSLTYADGWEASFTIGAGSYTLIGHAEVYAGGGQTSATTGFPGTGPSLVIECVVPTESSTWGKIKSLYR